MFKLMKYKNYYRVSNIQRDAILQEYLTSDLSCRELAERYGLKTNTISKWVQRYLNQNNVVSLQVDTKPLEDMARKKKEEKTPEVLALEARVRELELQNLALNTLIDVAEKNGIDIRKKSGAKQ
jgi:transposase-like protein